MKVHATTDRAIAGTGTVHGWDIVHVPSKSNPAKYYTVDITLGRCDCPAWKFQKGETRTPCKHLRELGFTRVVDFSDTIKEPTKVTQVNGIPVYEEHL